MTYELYQTDAYDLLDSWPNYAALLSDPPWGMSYQSTHSTAPNRSHLQRKDGDFAPILGDDQPFDPTPFLRFDTVVLWGAQYFAHKLPPSRQWLIWDKRAGKTPSHQSDAELAWTNRSGPTRLYTHLWRGAMRAGEENIVHSPKLHPNQKPIALWTWVLDLLQLPLNMPIIDPFAGSASLGKAAQRLGYHYIGIELDPHYYQIALRTLQPFSYQLPLLNSPTD